MTRDDDNPYRFVEAVEMEESADPPQVPSDGSADEERWDLRDYVAPTEGPLYSPQEIAELGSQWSGLALSTFVDLPIAFIAAFLAFVTFVADTNEGAAIGLLIYACMAVAGFRILLWAEAYRLLSALRYAPGRSALAATLYAVPIANLSLLFPLKAEAIETLRRHGIPAGFWRVPAASLPRRVKSGASDRS
jgi:hypothetical protein